MLEQHTDIVKDKIVNKPVVCAERF